MTVDHVNTQRIVTPSGLYSSVSLETFTVSNRQLVAMLAKQNLFKGHLNLFKGDFAMFPSWKRSFKLKAMMRDADIAPEQELNYLRSFTSRNPQEVVDNFWKRKAESPATTLRDYARSWEGVWQSSGVRLCTAANFSDKDNAKLQKLAHVCADVDCQMTHLPGLACLSYPIAIRPVV